MVFVVLLVLFLSLLVGFYCEGKWQKRIISLRNSIKEIEREGNQEKIVDFRDEPLLVNESMLLQENEDPYGGNPPSFKVHSYGVGCDLVSDQKGIW